MGAASPTPKGLGRCVSCGATIVYRGTGSQLAFRAAQAVFDQRGILGIFPEGSSAVAVLRPPRPGAAFMAARAQVPILPIRNGWSHRCLPKLLSVAQVTIRIGKPIGPFGASSRGRARRERLDEIGHIIMQLHCGSDTGGQAWSLFRRSKNQAAVRGTDLYPWDDEPEL